MQAQEGEFSSDMSSTINLKEFCKKYPGGFQAILPPEGLGMILEAIANGNITNNYAKILLKKWFSLIECVGIDKNGNPIALFNEEGMDILKKSRQTV